jgi:hypothetical protein
MVKLAAGLAVLGFALVGCAHSADTVVHVSASPNARWQVHDADGERVCQLPCRVELDEQDVVTVSRPGKSARFLLRQADLGEGDFSAAVRVKRARSASASVAGAFAVALTTAGTVLLDSDDRRELAAGVFLSGMGAVAGAVSKDAGKRREELWVERTQQH